MVDVVHAHPSCRAVAFRLRCTFKEAANGVVLNATMVAYNDGRTIHDDDGTGVLGDLIRCQACGRTVSTRVVGDRLIAVSDAD